MGQPGWLAEQTGGPLDKRTCPSLGQLVLQQELKLNPTLFKAADFNEGFLLPMLNSFTGVDVTTIFTVTKNITGRKSLKVQVASLLCH